MFCLELLWFSAKAHILCHFWEEDLLQCLLTCWDLRWGDGSQHSYNRWVEDWMLPEPQNDLIAFVMVSCVRFYQPDQWPSNAEMTWVICAFLLCQRDSCDHQNNTLLVQSEWWFCSLLFSFNIQIFTYYIILKQNILGFSVGRVIQVLPGTGESGPLITMAF